MSHPGQCACWSCTLGPEKATALLHEASDKILAKVDPLASAENMPGIMALAFVKSIPEPARRPEVLLQMVMGAYGLLTGEQFVILKEPQ